MGLPHQYLNLVQARPTEWLRPVDLYLLSTAMKARGVTKFHIPALARANQKKKRDFAKFSKVLPSGV